MCNQGHNLTNEDLLNVLIRLGAKSVSSENIHFNY